MISFASHEKREDVELAEAAIERMSAARAVAERAIAGQTTVYGVTTGVGVRKLFPIEATDHDRLLVRQHLIGQGAGRPAGRGARHDPTARKRSRSGRTTARPELAAHVVRALNEDRLPEVRLLGSIGISDLAPLADLAEGILGDFQLEQGEGIALLNQSAFSTGIAALALHDALTLLDMLDHAGALDYEAFGANRDALHPAIGVARPSAGLQFTLARISDLLEGSGAEARALQDPLSFRALPQLHGAARDAFGFVRAQVELELNAAQSNPLVLTAEDRMISVGNFEIQPLATALDLARLALAPVLSAAAERSVKLLQASLTGLNEGLGARSGLAESALSEYGIAVQAFASEARLLAQPVSLDLVSTTQAEGIEDRMTMAPLAARRLGEMVELGARVVSVELLHAAQACDLRGTRLGVGTARVHRAVRDVVPFVGEGELLPDLEPLVMLIRSGGLGG